MGRGPKQEWTGAKLEAFALEYLKDFCLTKAMERFAAATGMETKAAAQAAWYLSEKPEFAAIVKRLVEERRERLAVEADDVVRELMGIGFADPAEVFDADGNLLPIHQMPERVRRAIASVEVKQTPGLPGHVLKIKWWNKPQGLELIGKHIGMWEPKPQEHTGAIKLILEDFRGNPNSPHRKTE